MSNVDPRTFGWKRPRTLDGRRYPLYLREFEQYDTAILAVIAELEPVTYDDIEARLDHPKVAAELSGWGPRGSTTMRSFAEGFRRPATC